MPEATGSIEERRSTPVRLECDVLVAGGGTAGLEAHMSTRSAALRKALRADGVHPGEQGADGVRSA